MQTYSVLLARLKNARAQILLTSLLRSTEWSILVALCIYVLLKVFNILLPRLTLSAASLALGTFVLGLIATFGFTLARLPSLLEIARRADHHFNLQERLGTAIELFQGTGEISNGTVHALLDDAERHVRTVNLRRLAPFHFGRVGWWIIALVVVSGAWHIGLPRQFVRSAPVNANLPILSAKERSKTATELLQAAMLLRSEAEQQKDPYLQALAQSFDDLARRVASGSLDRITTKREFDQLLTHVARARGDTSSSKALRPAQQPAAGNGASKVPPDPGTDAQKLQDEGTSRASSKSRVGTSDDLESLLGALDQVEVELSQAKQQREATEARVTSVDIQKFGPYVNPESLERLRREREEREVQQAQAGQPVGAAQEATKGVGDLAGEGVQSLTGNQRNRQPMQLRPEQVILPDRQRALGEGLEVELAPEARLSKVASTQPEVPRDWRRGGSVELRREQLGPRERVVASRYFGRSNAEASGP